MHRYKFSVVQAVGAYFSAGNTPSDLAWRLGHLPDGEELQWSCLHQRWQPLPQGELSPSGD